MPDLSMCTQDECPSKSICYRHEAKPGMWQYYSVFYPDETGKCSDFLEIHKVTEHEKACIYTKSR